MKITYEEVHYIDPLHYISSISNFHAHTSSYKLSPLHFGATWCTTTCCASALPRARRLQMASLTAQMTLIPPILTLTSVIQRRKRVAQYVGMHVSAVAAAGTCACFRYTLATKVGVLPQPLSGASSPPSKLPESPIITSPTPPSVENEVVVVGDHPIPPLPPLPTPPPHTPPAGSIFAVLFRGVRVWLRARARARHLPHPQLYFVENGCCSSEHRVCVSSSGRYRCYLMVQYVCREEVIPSHHTTDTCTCT